MKDFNVEDYILTREVKLTSPEKFTVIMETLERIGMVSLHNKTLFQSCHILQKRGKFYIVHFKEMYALDNKECTLSIEDVAIRNLITTLLVKWGMVELVNTIEPEPIANALSINIIPYKERQNWNLQPKYRFRYKNK